MDSGSSENLQKSSINTGGFVDYNSVPISREELVRAYTIDPILRSLHIIAVSENEVDIGRTGYYLHNDVLMRKSRSPENNIEDEIHQGIIPLGYRATILSIAHYAIGGHLGVKKTLDRILEYFCWPGIMNDVRKYCRSCKICQWGNLISLFHLLH